jgi:hypothetical protein
MQMQRVLDKSDADVVTRKPSRAAAIKIEVWGPELVHHFFGI